MKKAISLLAYRYNIGSKPPSDSQSLHQQGNNYIVDDWEFIEVLDRELTVDGNGDDADVSDGDYEYDDHLFSCPKVKYTIVSSLEVRRHLEEIISGFSNVLLLQRAEVMRLLYHFKWNVSKTQDEWLESEEKVRMAVGLFERPIVEFQDLQGVCGICRSNFSREAMLAVSCGHQFCLPCWTDYISKAISKGPECLALRCPEPDCVAAVGFNMVELLASEAEKEKYELDLLRSYLKKSKEAKFCPGPDCEYAVCFSGDGDGISVTCPRSHTFCCNCAIEAHSPVSCDLAAMWMSEIPAQSNNWRLANTKPCPSCESSIELRSFSTDEWNDQYVKCTFCSHEFCRFCGVEPTQHLTSSTGNYACFSDQSRRVAGFTEADDRERMMARNDLVRFNRYYHAWSNCEASAKNVLAGLQLFKHVNLQILSSVLNLPSEDLSFLIEAQQQTAECWKIMKWTYVYDYYLPDDECTKKSFLEFIQGEAQKLVESLQKNVSKLESILDKDNIFEHFKVFRADITKLTRVTRKYYEKLVDAMRSGLSQVVSAPTPALLNDMA